VGTELGCAADMLIREDLPNAQLKHYNDASMQNLVGFRVSVVGLTTGIY
jgi:hypothetical protein